MGNRPSTADPTLLRTRRESEGRGRGWKGPDDWLGVPSGGKGEDFGLQKKYRGRWPKPLGDLKSGGGLGIYSFV